MMFRFASLFICFIFAGATFSSHPLLSLDLYFLKQCSVSLWSADALLHFDRFVLTSVKMIEWHHKQWSLIFNYFLSKVCLSYRACLQRLKHGIIVFIVRSSQEPRTFLVRSIHGPTAFSLSRMSVRRAFLT